MDLEKLISVETYDEIKINHLTKKHENKFTNIYSNIFDDIEDQRWTEALDVG